MYQNAAILAAVILIYSAVAGRVGRSWLSGPILCTAAGLIFGPLGIGVLQLSLTATDLRVLAELALAMVLFADAAHVDLSVARRTMGLPERLLLIGLPLTIVLGYLFARLLFPECGALEAALIAALLAPTDAALGAPVVINKAVPAATREALNIESGLNDGICVPVVIVLLDFAVGRDIERSTLGHIVAVATEEVGIGLVVGISLTTVAAGLLRWVTRVGWTEAHWHQVSAIALAALCFTVAQAMGGSGFIACFTGGLLFGFLMPEDGL
ncbi:MAG TPA: cation:proton antiporter, partial [Rhodopila sp.]|nr:cation:proton antiporter [Rhodopila sp.]